MKYIRLFENGAEDFFVAVRQLSKNLVNDLLRRGCDINTRNKIGFTPLTSLLNYSPTKSNLDFLEFLISKGADVNVKDYFGSCPLTRAFLHGNLGAVDILVAAGANWIITDENDEFINYLDKQELKKLKKKFPRQFEDIALKKDAKKYNL